MLKAVKAIFLFTVMSVSGQAAWADTYSDTIEAFRNAGESSGYFGKSYAYAVFPTIGKGGIGIGGAYGEGRVYVGGQHVGNSTMAQVLSLIHI